MGKKRKNASRIWMMIVNCKMELFKCRESCFGYLKECEIFHWLTGKGTRATRSPVAENETPSGCFILLLLAESRQQGKTTGGQTDGATSFRAVQLPHLEGHIWRPYLLPTSWHVQLRPAGNLAACCLDQSCSDFNCKSRREQFPTTSLLITTKLFCCGTNLCRVLNSIIPFPGSTSRKSLTASADWKQMGRVTSNAASLASQAFCSLQLAPRAAATHHPICGLDIK